MPKSDLSWLTARPIAHRGLHSPQAGIEENTRSAFVAAMEQNFAIELDVQLTKDGQAAVFHDYDLERLTTSKGKTINHTMAELQTLSLRQGSDRIEPLGDILSLIAGRVPVVIELKSPKPHENQLLEEDVSRLLENYSGHAAVMSFSPDVVLHLKALTTRPRGIVSCDYFVDEDGEVLSHQERYALTHLLHAKATEPDFISYGIDYLPAPSVDLMKALFDLPVICWTTTNEDLHKKAMHYCDQVTFEGYNPDLLT
ncbi:MAG: glycerophosphodiester phosphodiesterase family protein [Cohaesibacter sp.]|jgi:glycerophosphoryl diester phosphodiesterase|nr:glycerophosphodiester phosphodiesterase family protein [Cohaesibacter sp.]